jgi:hypothetical protein
MTRSRVDELMKPAPSYRGAKSFPFVDNVSTMLMSCASSDSTGKGPTGRPRPWLQHHDASRPHPGVHARLDVIRRFSPRARQMAVAERRHVGQLAHDQEVLGAHRLLGERHSHENPRRCLARGSRMEEGARWAGANQC